ncbi:cbb3-type cytochrome c oxidase subunit I [Gluconobacter sphaericus]|uniref:cbb3-type cytochrome c oxidase subunit I n=1 Tax=Gluconobacter sphaericus TaxID=574987 RepID=UPI001B8C9EC8|nr:cbb3-type cytochrome c oxidase subunit I [Gluconobacter sphaericus]MBS1084869.1 cbb3-type cytochrome c oxidase subunit I [Gluconobacter sphaericus]MBS1099486.1 cbb3-type cytochrome c oxidase subunit I [Gluconobacter sphaericus]
MTYQAVDTAPARSSRRVGTSFILLALFAGLLGGSLALPMLQTHPTSGQAFCHGILMTFFVMCPAALGGFGQWLLPSALGINRTVLRGLTMAGFGFLSSGVVLLPVLPFVALLLWSVGILAVAIDVITTCVEGRTYRFRDMSPLAWSLLATACSVVLVAPVLAAVVTRGMMDGITTTALIETLHLPETALMLTPALGLVASALLSRSSDGGASWVVAPYVFGIMGIGGPLLWMDGLYGSLPAGVTASLVVVTQIVPSMVLICALCRDVWQQKRDLDGAALWAIGSILLFTAGWLSDWLPGHSGDHTAVAFGGIMALCGGFYAWVEMLLPRRIPVMMSRLHAGLMLVGAFCSIVPGVMIYGEVLMGISLLAFGLVGLFLLRETGRARVSA